MQRLYMDAENTVDRDAKLRLYHTVNVVSAYSFFMLLFYLAEPFLHRVVKSFLANAFSNDTQLSYAIEQIYSMFAYACTFFLPLFLTLLLFRRKGIAICALHPNIPFSLKLPKRPIASMFAVIGVLYVIGDLSNRILSFASDIGIPITLPTQELPNTPLDILLYFLSSVILPAFVEELIFRGYILHLLLPHGKSFAILVSGVLFGTMHFYLPQLLYASIAGVLIGYLVVQSGSIWYGIFLHIMNNLLVFVSGMASVLLDEATYLLFSVMFEGAIYLCGMTGLIIVMANSSDTRRHAFLDYSDGVESYTGILPISVAFRYLLTPLFVAYLLCAVIGTVQNSFVFAL